MKSTGKIVSKKKSERGEVYNRLKFLFDRIKNISEDIGKIKENLAFLNYVHKEELKDIPKLVEEMQKEVEAIEGEIALENAIKDAIAKDPEKILETIEKNQSVEISTDEINLTVKQN
jgi:hypothetical protein